MLVFFDDILIYNSNEHIHLDHLGKELQLLQKDNFYIQLGVSSVDYLGHVISGDRVRTDPKKIEAMKDWHIPKNMKDLRDFLGLTNYYKNLFVGMLQWLILCSNC